MTYQIQIKSDLNEDFIQIIQSLKNIGLVENFRQADSLSLENSPLSESSLLKVLKEREKEIEDGNFWQKKQIIPNIYTLKSIIFQSGYMYNFWQ